MASRFSVGFGYSLSVLVALAGMNFGAVSLRAQHQASQGGVFQTGEKLTYKVKWGFLRLGTVTLETERSSQNTRKYLIQIEARSSLPIFKFQRKSESELDPNFLFSENLVQYEFEDGDTIETRVRFDRETNRSSLTETNQTKGKTIRSLEQQAVHPYLDAISMWFFARSMARSAQVCTVQTLRDFEFKPTRLDFRAPVSEFDIGAIDESIPAIEMVGATAAAGQSSGGFEGDFHAWFSDDDAAVMLKAEIKIAVGKVKIELESWERNGWEPPTWKERKLAKR
jgi:hypothetical protein